MSLAVGFVSPFPDNHDWVGREESHRVGIDDCPTWRYEPGVSSVAQFEVELFLPPDLLQADVDTVHDFEAGYHVGKSSADGMALRYWVLHVAMCLSEICKVYEKLNHSVEEPMVPFPKSCLSGSIQNHLKFLGLLLCSGERMTKSA